MTAIPSCPRKPLPRATRLIERLAALASPCPPHSNQLIHHFGHEAVAEVTGRSRRVLKIVDSTGERLALKSRPASANLSETAAFMEGSKKNLGVLDGRGDRAQLSRGARLRSHRAPRSLLAGTRLAGQTGDPGTGPDPPHATKTCAPVFRPGDHRREGRTAVHRHHREKARQFGGADARTARFADVAGRRRRGALQGPRQPRKPVRPSGA